MSLSGKAKGASVRGKIHIFAIDKTLTIEGAAADAKAVGDALGLNENNTFIQGGGIKYFRINDGKLEWSYDGVTWHSVNIGGTAGDVIVEGDSTTQNSTVIKSENIKYLRINNGVLEWSVDGKVWHPFTTGGGDGGSDGGGGGGITYTLPIASSTTLGGVKIGEGLAIDENGVLSVTATVVEELPNGDEVEY